MPKSTKKIDLRHGGTQIIDPAGVPVDWPGRNALSPWRKLPIMMQWRQVAPIHAGDTGEMLDKWVNRKRYTRWHNAWAQLVKEAKSHPWAEWRLVEDLLPRLFKRSPPGTLQWSQICKACQQWGVRPTEDDPQLARCVRCGAIAAPVKAPMTIGPLRVPASIATHVVLGVTDVLQVDRDLIEWAPPVPPELWFAFPPRRASRLPRHPECALAGLRRDR